jgi:hypothetical protein
MVAPPKEETKEELIEEIKEEELMRRWHHINFARRIRKMAKTFVKVKDFKFTLRVDMDSVKFKEVT